MSQYLPLTARNKEYILYLFDSGANLHQILDALYASGQMGVQYVTIQRCLQENGRLLPSIDSPQHPTPYSGPNPAAIISWSKTPKTQVPDAKPSAGHAASVYNPTNQVSTSSKANAPPIYNWGPQADVFAMSAHRYGQTVSQIAEQLRNNGYDRVTLEEVMASLNRQGVNNARW